MIVDLMERLKDLEVQFGSITNNTIKMEAFDVARRPQPGEPDERVAWKRIQNMGVSPFFCCFSPYRVRTGSVTFAVRTKSRQKPGSEVQNSIVRTRPSLRSS